ncbi:hypothetical protein [Roseomonas elaeocarpi]|uniref:Uncharacterized protein n=1 Tax=Roseomonas elaeocarpi TaxID=907779 RepID=A0ABV6JT33_9PROT
MSGISTGEDIRFRRRPEGGDAEAEDGHGLLGILGRTARITLWGLVTFALTFLEQIAEILAPLLLVAGIAWWLVVHVTAGLHVDPMVQGILEQVPTRYWVGGYNLSPSSLITNGVLAVAVVAACRTLTGIIAKES